MRFGVPDFIYYGVEPGLRFELKRVEIRWRTVLALSFESGIRFGLRVFVESRSLWRVYSEMIGKGWLWDADRLQNAFARLLEAFGGLSRPSNPKS